MGEGRGGRGAGGGGGGGVRDRGGGRREARNKVYVREDTVMQRACDLHVPRQHPGAPSWPGWSPTFCPSPSGLWSSR